MTIDQRLEALEEKMERQEDYRQILNLMGRYQYLFTAGSSARIARELYAADMPGNHCEYGPLGVFAGEKAIEFFDQVTENFCTGKDHTDDGVLEIHQITTPVIEIAGDGKTAKGMWMSTGSMMMANEGPDGTFLWDVGKYAVDFIKLDSGWKIWHLHVCDLWRSPFGVDPVVNRKPLEPWTTREMIDEYNRRAAAGEDVRPQGFPIPDAPTTFHYIYSSDAPGPALPPPPEPYYTFSETFSY